MARLWLAAALAIFLGCGERGGGAPADPKAAPADSATVAPQGEPAMLEALDRLGDGAAVVGVIDPRSWPTVHQRLLPVFAKLPAPIGAQFADLKDLRSLIQGLPRFIIGVPPPTLDGLDESRPLVFSLFEATSFGPPGAAAASINFDAPHPLRHEFILPASDPAALHASVRAFFGKMGASSSNGFNLGRAQVGVKAEGDVVRVVILSPAKSTQIEALWRTPLKASIRTPAFVELASPGAGIGLLIRPWRMRVAYGHHGASQIIEALSFMGSGSDRRMAMFAKGLSIVLSSAALMHAERPDLEDSVVRLSGDDAGIFMTGTHTLTQTLATALTTAVSKGGRLYATKVPFVAQARQRIDLRALLDGVGPSPIFAHMKRLRDFAQGWSECGFGCALHTAVRTPISTIRGAMDLAPAEVRAALRTLPSAVQLVLVKLDPKGPPQVALAADVPQGFDTGVLRQARGMLQVYLTPKDDRAVLLVGLQIDPRTVFDLTKIEPLEGISSLQVDLSTLANGIAAMDAFLATALDGLGGLTLQSAQAPGGRAFVWRAHLTTSPGVQASVFTPNQTQAFESPIRGYTPSAGDACAAKMVGEAGQMFDALANVEPSQRAMLIQRGFDEMAPSIKCAAQHETTRPSVDGLRRLFVQMVLIGAEQRGPDDALPFVEAQCAQSKDAWTCAQVGRLKAMPSLSPPTVTSHCREASQYPPGETVRVTAKGLFVGSKAIELAGIKELEGPITINADKTLTFAAVKPVFQALAKRKIRVMVRVETSERRFSIAPAYVASAPPEPVNPKGPVVLTVDPDTPYDEIVKKMDAIKADGRSVVFETNRMQKFLKGDQGATAQPALMRAFVQISPGNAAVFAMRDGAPQMAGPLGDGRALNAAVGDNAAWVRIDPKTPWPEAAQALAAVCQHAHLTESAPPAPKAVEPPTGVGLSALGVKATTSLDRAVIQRVMRTHGRQVRFCYQKQLVKNPKLAGKVMVSLTVAPDGSVAQIEATGDSELGAVISCVEQFGTRWKFPTATGVTKIRYPFVLKAQ